MVSPIATKTLGDVVTHTKRQFGDESGVQVTDADIMRWVNQAQMEIVNKNPILQATATQTGVKGQQQYDIPTRLIQIESVMWKGNILEPRSFEGIRQELGSDNNVQGQPLYWYLWNNKIYLWPVPSTADQISINYSAEPNEVTSPANTLGVPDRYYERVCEFVLAKCYELDEDWSAYTVSKQGFEDKLLESTNSNLVMRGSFPVAFDVEYEG